MLNFLQTTAFNFSNSQITGGLMGGFIAGIIALGIIIMFMFFLLMIAIYVYTSFAFMAIAKKAKLSAPGIAFIPSIGPLIIAYQASEMHWWPWLLLISIIIPFLNIFALITFAVFSFIWIWKMFEAVNKPGWWVLLSLIPFAGAIIFLILLGVAAWSKK